MTAPAVSDPAPSIPTLNLQDPADRARLPKRCWNCGSRMIFPSYEGLGTDDLTCLACSRVVAEVVSHPVRRALSPAEWEPKRGRPPKGLPAGFWERMP